LPSHGPTKSPSPPSACVAATALAAKLSTLPPPASFVAKQKRIALESASADSHKNASLESASSDSDSNATNAAVAASSALGSTGTAASASTTASPFSTAASTSAATTSTPTASATAKTSILSLTLPELTAQLSALGVKSFRARQIWHWVYRRGVRDFGAMSDLSAGLRAQLADAFRWVVKWAKISHQFVFEKFLFDPAFVDAKNTNAKQDNIWLFLFDEKVWRIKY
jgi:hypothetical protein